MKPQTVDREHDERQLLQQLDASTFLYPCFDKSRGFTGSGSPRVLGATLGARLVVLDHPRRCASAIVFVVFFPLVVLLAGFGIASPNLHTALPCSCSATPPPGYTAAEIDAAREDALLLAGDNLDAAQRDRLRGVALRCVDDPEKEDSLAWERNGKIYVHYRRLKEFAPSVADGGDLESIKVVLSAILLHEFYHLEPPTPANPGGRGPNSGGVPGGTEPEHIGLQLWTVDKACERATQAHNAGNTDAARRACKVARRVAATLMRGGTYYPWVRAAIEQNGNRTVGPPDWGVRNPMFPPGGQFQNGWCEVCQVHYPEF